MRKSIIIALALTSSFALTACGNGKHSAKAKVAAAKALGDSGMQKENVRDIEKKIEETKKSLANEGFHGLEGGGNIYDKAKSYFKSYDPSTRAKIKQQLGEVKGQAEALIEAGNDLKGAEGDQARSTGETLKERAMKGIEQMNREEKAEQESNAK